MTRYRVTVRGTSVELRGYIDGNDTLTEFASALVQTFGRDPMVVASPVEDDYNPFKVVPARVDLADYAERRDKR